MYKFVNVNLGFDAKRAFLNSSGLGSYSRNTLNALQHFFPENNYFLFTPEINNEYFENISPFKVITPEYSIAKKEITERCEKLALDAWKILGCQDGGRVDIRCDEEGEPNFIEVNPLAGLHPKTSDLPILSALNGISYTELLERIMESALLKIKPEPKR